MTLDSARGDFKVQTDPWNLSRPKAVQLDHIVESIAVHGIKHPVHDHEMLADALWRELADRTRPYSWQTCNRAGPQVFIVRVEQNFFLPRARVDHVLDPHKLGTEIF